jgi:hypothetical protein
MRMATIKLSHPFTHEGVSYSEVSVPDKLLIGHQDWYFEHKDQFTPARLGFRLCAMMCEIPMPAFLKMESEDFARVSAKVSKLLPKGNEKEEKKILHPRKG